VKKKLRPSSNYQLVIDLWLRFTGFHLGDMNA